MEGVMADQVELIVYADRLGGDLPGLRDVLHGPLAGLFGGVHLLPFFTPYDGADAGFDPEDHTEVDERLGTWEDVARIADEFDVMVDVIVNHVSARSRRFLDWLTHGQDSAYDGMFLTFAGAFPLGATEEDLVRLYRPRPGLPFTAFQRADGTKRLLWTTFTPEQVDVDVRNSITQQYLVRVLDRLAAAGVRRVRLDAVGYAVKTPGLTSFMTPETIEFIADVTTWCRERGLEVLVEVHSYYRQQIEIARQVDRVYDFALPPLVLHALTAADAEPLLAWLRIRPVNAVTVLDTHDGIGVIDVGADATDRSRPGLLTPEQIDRLVEAIHEGSRGTSRLATGEAASNVDLYQVNCTYYDALGRDDDRYLLARAMQFLTPGVPQVYYVGLLAGGNDMELLERSNVGRDVNRHHYDRAEIERELQRPVVQALLRLIRFRSTHPAFEGTFSVTGGGPRLTMTWIHHDEQVALDAALDTAVATLTWTEHGIQRRAALSRLP
jgi:sucrose phosphorylase